MEVVQQARQRGWKYQTECDARGFMFHFHTSVLGVMRVCGITINSNGFSLLLMKLTIILSNPKTARVTANRIFISPQKWAK